MDAMDNSMQVRRILRASELKHALCLFLCFSVLTNIASPQKVKVGYDKSVNYARYKTYSWAEPAMPPAMPLLYATVVGAIDRELSSKGLRKVEKDGDLTLIGAGGIGFGNNVASGSPIIASYDRAPLANNATMWTGAEGPSALSAPYVPEGTVTLEFVDRSENKAVWTGTVSQKLDIEKKNKSLDLADKAIVKLLKQFPPKNSPSK